MGESPAWGIAQAALERVAQAALELTFQSGKLTQLVKHLMGVCGAVECLSNAPSCWHEAHLVLQVRSVPTEGRARGAQGADRLLSASSDNSTVYVWPKPSSEDSNE